MTQEHWRAVEDHYIHIVATQNSHQVSGEPQMYLTAFLRR
jgi:hypothetical protein